MKIVADLIKHRLSNGYNYSVIVSGLHRSGKTAMLKELAGEYPYIKYEFDVCDGSPLIPWDRLFFYQIFDRSPIIDKYVSEEKDCNERLLYQNWRIFFDSHIQYYTKPLFVFYLHDVWNDGTKARYEKYKKIQLNRYLKIIEYLTKNNYDAIVLAERSMKCYFH